ncbi:hypothetical protein Ais01nite_33380 [Asanoa ishikariensis]|uniref:WD40-like Beta Propeller Repeat n=1 Tax=Asanoa ishikariensis TaxID=137265 RepID=A0A1H3L796_9ACTN|nr:hypothetical protein [Asanoa ishikariensis]GIF65303.1 hypothetical protein Ais01nite_33380 [Asanoa ishikariensis]SDY60292.1 hypothetical protein SAMN05421684_0583 [Asanoa ishikariensis]
MISEERVAELIRTAVDAVPVEPPPPATFRARATARRRDRRRAGRIWPAALAAAAVVATVMVATVTLPGPSTVPGEESTTYRLPRELAGSSSATTPVSQDPPGRAIALFNQGGHHVVLATDGVTYRRLDLADQLGAALLSPDGLTVIVSDPARTTPHVEVVDLRTGQAQRFSFDPPLAVRPLAWSPNGRRVAFATQVSPTGNSAGPAGVSVLDLDSRRFVQVAEPRPGTAGGLVQAAFIAAGSAVLASAGAEDGCTLRVYQVDPPKPAEPVSVDGPVERCREVVTLAVHPLDTATLVAVGERYGNILRLNFRGDWLAQTRTTPPSIPLSSGDRLLGWSGRDRLYATLGSSVEEFTLEGGYDRVLRFPAVSDGPDLVTAFQLATDLMPETTVSDLSSGGWPWSLRRSAAVAFLLLVVTAAVLVIRRRRTA